MTQTAISTSFSTQALAVTPSLQSAAPSPCRHPLLSSGLLLSGAGNLTLHLAGPRLRAPKGGRRSFKNLSVGRAQPVVCFCV